MGGCAGPALPRAVCDYCLLITVFWHGGVAQLGERRLCKPEVVGSIPITSTTGAGADCSGRERVFGRTRGSPPPLGGGALICDIVNSEL